MIASDKVDAHVAVDRRALRMVVDGARTRRARVALGVLCILLGVLGLLIARAVAQSVEQRDCRGDAELSCSSSDVLAELTGATSVGSTGLGVFVMASKSPDIPAGPLVRENVNGADPNDW